MVLPVNRIDPKNFRKQKEGSFHTKKHNLSKKKREQEENTQREQDLETFNHRKANVDDVGNYDKGLDYLLFKGTEKKQFNETV